MQRKRAGFLMWPSKEPKIYDGDGIRWYPSLIEFELSRTMRRLDRDDQRRLAGNVTYKPKSRKR